MSIESFFLKREAGGPPVTRLTPEMEQHRRLVGHLAPKQLEVVQRVLRGENTLALGPAGTGKTTMVKALVAVAIMEACRKNSDRPFPRDRESQMRMAGIHVSAMTGCAAAVYSDDGIPATTMHKLFGVGAATPQTTVESLMANVKPWHPSFRTLRAARIIVIDEISMMSQHMFSLLDRYLRKVRRNEMAFGGVTLLCVGDFYQLPPVDDPRLLCESPHFKLVYPRERVVVLDTIYRQQTDVEFRAFLDRVRHGCVTMEDTLKLIAKERDHNNGKLPQLIGSAGRVQLRTHVAEVDRINNEHLMELRPDTAHRYNRSSRGDPTQVERLIQSLSHNAPVSIELRLLAQVMVTKNHPCATIDGRVLAAFNGMTGVVIGFATQEEIRKLTPDGLVDVYKLKSVFNTQAPDAYPLVMINEHTILHVQPHRWSNLPETETRDIDPFGTVDSYLAPEAKKRKTSSKPTKNDAMVEQVPLRLGWAITVHRGQGRTIDDGVEMDIKSVDHLFVPGMVYTGLTRGCSFSHILLTGLMKMKPPDRARCFPRNEAAERYDAWLENRTLEPRSCSSSSFASFASIPSAGSGDIPLEPRPSSSSSFVSGCFPAGSPSSSR